MTPVCLWQACLPLAGLSASGRPVCLWQACLPLAGLYFGELKFGYIIVYFWTVNQFPLIFKIM